MTEHRAQVGETPAAKDAAVIAKLGPICAPHLKKALERPKPRHKKVLERARRAALARVAK